MGIRKNPPTKWSTQYEHNLYGIVNHLHNKYDLNESESKEMINKFIEKEGFKPLKNKQKNKRAKLNFVQNRFSQFCHFVKKELDESK